MQNLADAEYDIAFIQPFDFVRIATKAGYLPLAALERPPSANIVVKANSGIKDLTGLRGKVLGMPPAVAAVSYLTKVALKGSGIDLDKDIELHYLRTHDDCIGELAAGRVDACAMALLPLRLAQSRINISLRLIKQTSSISSPLFVAHRRVPEHDREIIKRALLDFDQTRAGRETLHFKPVNESDYADVREYLRQLKELEDDGYMLEVP